MFCEIKSKPSDENSQAKDLFLIKLFRLLCLLLLFENMRFYVYYKYL